MSNEVEALTHSLDILRSKLMATPRSAEGFGEMRALYRQLTVALIDAGDRADSELAAEIEKVSTNIVEEWRSNKDKFSSWLDVLRPVVDAAGTVLKAGSLSNPLLAFLS